MVFPMNGYVLKTRADSPALRRAAIAIEQAAWSSLGFLNFTRAHFNYYQELVDEHADCQLCLVDEATGYPVAVGNCVPLTCDFNNLPPEGWDWIVETAANDRSRPANVDHAELAPLEERADRERFREVRREPELLAQWHRAADDDAVDLAVGQRELSGNEHRVDEELAA